MSYKDLSTHDLKELLKSKEIEMKQWKNLEQSSKINLNSLYGACGNAYFRYFDIRIAKAITLTGQFIIKTSEKVSNEVLRSYMKDDKDRVVAIDTDSCMVTYEDIVNTHLKGKTDDEKVNFVDNFSEKVMVPAYTKAYEDIADQFGCTSNAMVMEREVISDAAYFQGKKRYFMNVIDNEGVRNYERDLKIKGIEAVKSSTPETVKKAMKETFYIILYKDQDDLRQFNNRFKKEFMKMPVDEISIPTSANNHNKWSTADNKYKKGTPIGVKAALNFNRYLNEHGLDKRYRKLVTDEKIRYVFLRKPNPLKNEDVIGYSEEFPIYFEEYIDYNRLYERVYLNIVKSLAEVINWDVTSNHSSLDSIFG